MNNRIPAYNPMIFNDTGYRMGNIDDAFRQHHPMIQPTNFRNEGLLLHNNVAPNVLNEQIIEYNINIDSIDRDISLYPSQFDFQVSFESTNREPVISKRIKNIKYLKLSQVILPNSHNIVKSGDEYVFSTADEDLFTAERVLILKLLEADNGKTLSTNTIFTNGCFLLYQDVVYGEYSVWISRNNVIVFPDSQLFNLYKLSVKLMDYDGDAMIMNGMDSSITDTTDLRCYTSPRSQMTISIVAGVVENYINTETKYSQ